MRFSLPILRARFALAIAVTTLGCGGSDGASAKSPVLHKSLRFAIPDDKGSLVSLPPEGAHATILAFFSPDCDACRDRMGGLFVGRTELLKKNTRIVFVSVLKETETITEARRALSSWGVVAPFLVDQDGTSLRQAGVSTLPATLVLDESGIVAWVAPTEAAASDVIAAVP